MTLLKWFSTRMRLACLIENSGLHRYADSVYIFQAADFEDAFLRALEIGRSLEKTYKNGEGREVRWKLKEIISLDLIADELTGAVEVYSEPVEPSENEIAHFDPDFDPSLSKPTQTV